MTEPPRPTPCVGVVCLRGDEVLLIKRGKPPREGQWSIPGGRMEWGEAVGDAARRELREETGVTAELLGLIEVLDHIAPDRHYVLIDFAARWIGGEVVAGDDAVEAGFFPLDEACAKVGWSETERIIRAAVARFAG